MMKKNIVFILADDLGIKDLSVEGSLMYETPNIDMIAQRGTRFTNAYANCPVCSPSRASILTGKYTTNHGITDWIGAEQGNERRYKRWEFFDGKEQHIIVAPIEKLKPAPYESRLNEKEITFAKVLQDHGYKTLFSGKWHLGEGDSCPENYGFDINIGGYEAGHPESYFSPYKNPKLSDGAPGENLDIRLATEVCNFMDDNKDRPFLAFLSFYSVHAPLQTNKELWEKYRNKIADINDNQNTFDFDRRLPIRTKQNNPIYCGMIENMDNAVGLVLNKIKELGLEENTIIVFTSDNGGVVSGDQYSTSLLPYRGGKGKQWEGGIREPLYIYDATLKQVPVCDIPAIGMDIYPTLLSLVGIAPYEEQKLDGVDLTNMLVGKDDPKYDRPLFWHYPHYGNQGGEPSSIIRYKNYKLIYYYEDGRIELYDLSNDIGETTNIAEREKEVAKELFGKLQNWLAETNAKFPTKDELYDDEAYQKFLARLSTEAKEILEKSVGCYLDKNFEPNENWYYTIQTKD